MPYFNERLYKSYWFYNFKVAWNFPVFIFEVLIYQLHTKICTWKYIIKTT